MDSYVLSCLASLEDEPCQMVAAFLREQGYGDIADRVANAFKNVRTPSRLDQASLDSVKGKVDRCPELAEDLREDIAHAIYD
eukprot:997229-Amphidinium_carterae.1